MNRRNLLLAGAGAAILATRPARMWAQSSPTSISISIGFTSPGKLIPSNFTGLSYEKAQLAHPGYFSASNHDLVGLVKRLGKRGVLRIGGNTSDFSTWTEQKSSIPAGLYGTPIGPDAGLNIDKTTKVTPEAIDQLRTFLDATGWDVLYGLDLGHGDPDSAAAEAAYAIEHLGSALIALQIGNEPDLFYRNGMRKPTYGFADYFAEWQTFASAIRKRTPSAPLAGPDVGNHIDWVESFAKQVPDARLLTSHFYAEGPPSDPNANIERLLHAHPKNEANMKRMVALGEEVHIPYRMSEANSCYHGGKEGVSNSFASALWGADYMLSLAQWGVAGVNFHGGGQGFYTPIAGGGAEPLVARPLFYGMLLASELLNGSTVPVTNDNQGGTLRAYASLSPSKQVSIVLLNLDESADANVSLNCPGLRGSLHTMALRGPSLASLSDVTFAGGTVKSDGSWQSDRGITLTATKGNLPVVIPKASGLLIRSEGSIHA